jgi:hypothetical protein
MCVDIKNNYVTPLEDQNSKQRNLNMTSALLLLFLCNFLGKYLEASL